MTCALFAHIAPSASFFFYEIILQDEGKRREANQFLSRVVFCSKFKEITVSGLL